MSFLPPFAWTAWALHRIAGFSAHPMFMMQWRIEVLRTKSDTNPNFSLGVIKGKCVSEGQMELWSTEPRGWDDHWINYSWFASPGLICSTSSLSLIAPWSHLFQVTIWSMSLHCSCCLHAHIKYSGICGLLLLDLTSNIKVKIAIPQS